MRVGEDSCPAGRTMRLRGRVGEEHQVPPMIQKALQRHRRDLPGLIKGHAKQWVAYRGDERLEFGKSKRALYHKYLDRGLTLDELVVLGVEPELPDELDPSEWAHV